MNFMINIMSISDIIEFINAFEQLESYVVDDEGE